MAMPNSSKYDLVSVSPFTYAASHSSRLTILARAETREPYYCALEAFLMKKMELGSFIDSWLVIGHCCMRGVGRRRSCWAAVGPRMRGVKSQVDIMRIDWPMRRLLALRIAVVAGTCGVVVVSGASGRREAWDSQWYFLVSVRWSASYLPRSVS